MKGKFWGILKEIVLAYDIAKAGLILEDMTNGQSRKTKIPVGWSSEDDSGRRMTEDWKVGFE